MSASNANLHPFNPWQAQQSQPSVVERERERTNLPWLVHFCHQHHFHVQNRCVAIPILVSRYHLLWRIMAVLSYFCRSIMVHVGDVCCNITIGFKFLQDLYTVVCSIPKIYPSFRNFAHLFFFHQTPACTWFSFLHFHHLTRSIFRNRSQIIEMIMTLQGSHVWKSSWIFAAYSTPWHMDSEPYVIYPWKSNLIFDYKSHWLSVLQAFLQNAAIILRPLSSARNETLLIKKSNSL